MGRTIASRLGVWKRARKITVRQADKSKMRGGHYVINTSIVIPGATTDGATTAFANKFLLDAEVFDTGQKDVVLGLSWLNENGFSVDVPNSRLISSTGTVIPCAVRHLPSIQLISMDDLEELELEERELLLILDAKDRYSQYAEVFSAEFAARVPKHTKWDHKIPLKKRS